MHGRKPLLIVLDSPAVQKCPGFETWVAKAAKHFQLEFRNELPATLVVGSRMMQFRGDWGVWWLDPDRLADFKPWDELEDPECPDARTPPDTADC
jgi:hypothetical protein